MLQSELYARPATRDDAAFLLRLRNDLVTVAASMTREVVDVRAHLLWVSSRIATARAGVGALMVVVGSGFRVGTYRIDPQGADQEVSLTVRPDRRGLGLAGPIIEMAAAHAVRFGPDSVIARVRRDNARSLRAFVGAGFEPACVEGDAVRLEVAAERVIRRACRHCRTGVPHHTNAVGSIGGDDGRSPRWDLHAVDDAGGVGLAECDAGDLWLAWVAAKAAVQR